MRAALHIYAGVARPVSDVLRRAPLSSTHTRILETSVPYIVRVHRQRMAVLLTWGQSAEGSLTQVDPGGSVTRRALVLRQCTTIIILV
jgi:hypothetical protein